MWEVSDDAVGARQETHFFPGTRVHRFFRVSQRSRRVLGGRGQCELDWAAYVAVMWKRDSAASSQP